MARKWGQLLSVSSTAADKDRKCDDDVEIREIRADLEGMDAVIIDDESSTGVTAVRVAEFLKEQRNVRSVRLAVVHPKFVSGAIDRITSSPIQHVITSNTVPTGILPDQFTVCSVAQLLAAGIRGTYEQSSLSDLFEEQMSAA
jgi:ribose-phosphate pyrophosphokinase